MMATDMTNIAPPHPTVPPSGRVVEDFSPFCEGDLDPTLNKRINMLIDSEVEYIVYLDDEYFVQWSMSEECKQAAEFGEIANRVGHLETASMMLLRPDQIKPFRRMLGEAMARIIGDADAKQARAVLKIAEEFLHARGAERARQWYFAAASSVSSACVLLFASLWIARAWVSAWIGNNAFDVVTGMLAGGIGAILAISTSTKPLKSDASAGPWIHRMEGVVRVGTGVTGALLVALAIKANVVLGFTKSFDDPLAALYVFCFAAGWSERFVKSMVNRVENLVSGKAHEAPSDEA